MDAIYSIIGLFFLLWILALPQLIGLLVHFRMKRFPKLAYLVGFVTTIVLSFSILPVIFSPPAPKPGEYVCGLAAMASIMLILFFIGVQIVVSLIAQRCFYRRYRT
jgi:hypothetical protein